MSNKQTMKLYTEEQLKQMIEKSRETGLTADYLILANKGMELPSDEEVEQYLKSFPYTKHLDDGQYNDGKIVGAELAIQWFRNKIQGGNK
jgi:hypothetical protein